MLAPSFQAAPQLSNLRVGILERVLYQIALGLGAFLQVFVVRKVEHLRQALLPL